MSQAIICKNVQQRLFCFACPVQQALQQALGNFSMAEASTRLKGRCRLGPVELAELGFAGGPGVPILHAAAAVANGSQGRLVPDEPA